MHEPQGAVSNVPEHKKDLLEFESTWNWDWPPHALMLHLVAEYGRQQQLFSPRDDEKSCLILMRMGGAL